MRLSLPIAIAHLGVLVVGQETDDGWVVSGISEIDVMVPKPDHVYEPAPDNRFPLVVAVQNTSVWQHDEIYIGVDNITSSGKVDKSIYFGRLAVDNAGPDVQYLVLNVQLAPRGNYSIAWGIDGQLCADDNSGTRNRFNFTTAPGGQKSDFRSVLGADCAGLSAYVYNFGNYPDSGCSTHIARRNDDQPAAPCHLTLSAAETFNITATLDTQFNETCSHPALNYLCPQPPAQPEKKSAGIRLFIATWLLALPWIALVL